MTRPRHRQDHDRRWAQTLYAMAARDALALGEALKRAGGGPQAGSTAHAASPASTPSNPVSSSPADVVVLADRRGAE